MKRYFLLGFLALLPVGPSSDARDEAAKTTPVKTALEFNRDVRPILSDVCFHCHGPDKAKRKGDLRLDTEEGGKSVVVPGKPDQSELIARILGKKGHAVMPPPKSGRQLSPAQIDTLRRWVAEGAVWQPHWSFLAPTRPAIPEAREANNPIDRFVLSRLDKEGLSPSPEAPRSTLIRRLTLDLHGLPPTPDEVRAFVEDARPDAYARLVERLLESPRLGERLAYDWLDAARYADSNGYQSDRDRVMWPWRDWAVRAFNANTPFDRFIVEQLAGDLLPGSTQEQKLATGFHRNHPLNGEGGRVAEESRVDYVIDRVDTTGTVFLGLTVACARCHDHKYDPLKTKEYYGLYAFFNSIAESGSVDRGGNAAPVMDMPTPTQIEGRKRLQADIDATNARMKSAPEKVRPSIQKELKARQDALTAFNRSVVSVMVMEDRPTPRESHVLVRGAWDAPGEKVTPGVVSWLVPSKKDAPANRLTLAKWLVDARNPLTARVLVNRYWQLLFGMGLVKTAEDFGVQGEAPSHPELLDWLAVEFREGGWDLRHLLRLMVTSRTYRQSSRTTPALQERDPQNRLLARGPRYRLASTTIRDQALALSGLLVERIGGPPVKPYQPAGIWEEFSFGAIRYQQDKGPSLYRRSLYTFWRRTVGPTNLFDASTRQVCEVKPTRTNTPLHALVTLNDTTFAEASRVLGARMVREGGKTSAERLDWLFTLATARAPGDRERIVLGRAYARLLAEYRADPGAARALASVGESATDPTADLAELAASAAVASLVLNLDEVITRE